jgi:small subunit ribosomal protein S9
MSTFMATADHVAAGGRWHVIDAEGLVLGRIATAAARLLQGKHKASYTPFLDGGDHVVVVNAAKVKLTGRKEDQKIYRQHSGYEGGLREERARLVRQRRPERLVEEAVRGMLPKTKLGEAMYRKLKVYDRTTRTRRRNPPSSRSHNVAAVQYYGTGRRKTSTARVFLRPGSGAISVNQKTFETFFPTEALRTQIRQPLILTETADKFDILATVAGGGVSGQAGAVRLGIARALVEYNLELRKRLKDEGLLTRDARAKERKKYGMAGARKRFQFSKR